MFLDIVKLKIKAGNGGNGKVSFIRSAMTMYGGPDGGNGGKGGNIIFRATNDLNTLYSFKFKKKFHAEDGAGGDSNNQIGRSGKDLVIDVPCGTIIRNSENNKVLADLFDDKMQATILTGGNGGRGNTFYKSSTRRAPMFSQNGETTSEFEIVLELRTIADVGLVGYPNVGKSTLLSVISNARPKIADYHFTTLVPNLGVVDKNGYSFVVADIPGLIEGASEGAGLGHEFLRHIERVRLILHMIDISGSEGRDPYDDYLKINLELKKYSKILSGLEQIIVLTKFDLVNDKSVVDEFVKKLPANLKVMTISSITNYGISELINAIIARLSAIPKSKPMEVEQIKLDFKDKKNVEVIKEADKYFVLQGGLIDEFVRGIVLSDPTSFAYFQKRLKDYGIIDLLKSKGAKEGDIIKIKDVEFEMVD